MGVVSREQWGRRRWQTYFEGINQSIWRLQFLQFSGHQSKKLLVFYVPIFVSVNGANQILELRLRHSIVGCRRHIAGLGFTSVGAIPSERMAVPSSGTVMEPSPFLSNSANVFFNSATCSSERCATPLMVGSGMSSAILVFSTVLFDTRLVDLFCGSVFRDLYRNTRGSR